MATDYDRSRIDGPGTGEGDPVETLQLRNAVSDPQDPGVDEVDSAESFELPGADLSDEELTASVVPLQEDEFTCSRCFLVQHHSRLAERDDRGAICHECAA